MLYSLVILCGLLSSTALNMVVVPAAYLRSGVGHRRFGKGNCVYFGLLSAVCKMEIAMVQAGISLVGGVTVTSVIR